MKEKNGFTLVELLAVIVVLAIVMVLATTTVLPYMGTAREEAFRIEASSAVEGAEEALNLYALGQVSIPSSGTDMCLNRTTNKACFTVASLVDMSAYKADKDTFKGKIDVDISDKTNYEYTLYFKKNDEFSFINSKNKDFTNTSISLSDTSTWSQNVDTYEKCNCGE